MFAGILFFVGLIYGVAFGGLLEEDLPPEQARQFITDVIYRAKGSLVSHRDLPNVDYELKKLLVGVPLELALVTRNTILVGPSSIELYGNVEGQQLPSGSAMVRTTLAVGNLEVRFQYFLLDLFGYKYEGSAQMTVLDATVDVDIHIYRNVLTTCQVSTSISKPIGTFMVTIGEQGSWIRFVTSVVEYFLSRTVLPTWIMQWAFFPDIASHLEEIIGHAAKVNACG